MSRKRSSESPCPYCHGDYTYDDLRPEVRAEIERTERERDFHRVPEGMSLLEWLELEDQVESQG